MSLDQTTTDQAIPYGDIEAAVISLTGYTQPASYRVGLGILHRRIEAMLYDRRRWWTAIQTWNSDHATTAQRIDDLNPTQIIVTGYSYGCGWALKELAHELDKLGRSIDMAYLVDPVPRYKLLPAKVISLTRWGRYELPANVLHAWYWRQVNGSPFGRAVVHPDGMPVECRGVIGSSPNLAHHLDSEIEVDAKRLVSSASDHTTIDNNLAIHNYIISDLSRRLSCVA